MSEDREQAPVSNPVPESEAPTAVTSEVSDPGQKTVDIVPDVDGMS